MRVVRQRVARVWTCVNVPGTASSVAFGRGVGGCCVFQSDWGVVLDVCLYVHVRARQGRVQFVSVRGRPAGGSFDALSGLAKHLVCTQSGRMP